MILKKEKFKSKKPNESRCESNKKGGLAPAYNIKRDIVILLIEIPRF